MKKFPSSHGLKTIDSAQMAKMSKRTNSHAALAVTTVNQKVKSAYLNKQARPLSSKECMLCLTASCDAVLQDCGHGGVCYDCAVNLFKTQRKCMLCRQSIK